MKSDVECDVALDGAEGELPQVGVCFGESFDGFLADVFEGWIKVCHVVLVLNLVQK